MSEINQHEIHNFENEGGSAATAVEEEVVSPFLEQTGEEQQETQPPEEDTYSSIIDTPTAKLPPAVPDIHRGTIVSLTTTTFESGTSAIEVTLDSKDTAAQFTHRIFPPAQWFDGDYWQSGRFLVDELSTVPEPGKQMSDRAKYARNLFSSEGAETAEINGKEGEVQKLIKLATEQGRTPPVGRAADGEEFTAYVNQMVAGIDVVFTRTPDNSKDPAYAGRLKIGRIMSVNALDDPKFDKRFKPYNPQTGTGFKRAWTND